MYIRFKKSRICYIYIGMRIRDLGCFKLYVPSAKTVTVLKDAQKIIVE